MPQAQQRPAHRRMNPSKSNARPRHWVKQRIPWPAKFAIKLLLGATRINYRLLKRAGVVEHGLMEDANYARRVFELHVLAPARQWNSAPDGVLLEIGPGDSIVTGVLGRAAGFSAVNLIDTSAFADLRVATVVRLLETLGSGPQVLRSKASPEEVLAHLRSHGIHYQTEGARSLTTIADATVRHSFSNTVLQHVYACEVRELITQLARVHVRGGLSSHRINFTDHFSGGFRHRQLPDWLMESHLIKRAHLYTNRIGPLQYLELFERAGFVIRRLTVNFFDAAPPDSVDLSSGAEFRAANAERPVRDATYLLQRV